MADLKERLQALDRLETPDIWLDVLTRRPELPPRRNPSALRHAAVLVLVTAVTLGAGAGIWFGARSAFESGSATGPAISTFPHTPVRNSESAPPSRATLARMAAEHLLSELRLPPGTSRSAAAPAGSDSRLKTPLAVPADADLVDLTRYYTVPLSPSRVLSWVKSHRPTGASASIGGGMAGGQVSPGLWGLGLTWPPARVQPRLAPRGDGEVIDSAAVMIEATVLPGGRSALRVDSEVTWLPPKDRSDVVPASVKVLTASVPDTKAASVTTHDQKVIEQLRKAVSGLPVAPPSARSCPADLFGQSVRLAFGSPGVATPAAVVTADRSGCGFVSVIVDGKKGRKLEGGPIIVRLALRLLGLKLAKVN